MSNYLQPLTYSVQQAAQVLGISKPKVYELMKEPGFPYLKLGGRTLIYAEGLREWVALQVAKGQDVHSA